MVVAYLCARSIIHLLTETRKLTGLCCCVKHIVLTLIKYTDMVSHETNVEHLLNMK